MEPLTADRHDGNILIMMLSYTRYLKLRARMFRSMLNSKLVKVLKSKIQSFMFEK